MLTRKVCACLIGLELCPVHKKLPHIEVQATAHVRHVVDGIVAATTATVPGGITVLAGTQAVTE